jgi:hypothetical protein
VKGSRFSEEQIIGILRVAPSAASFEKARVAPLYWGNVSRALKDVSSREIPDVFAWRKAMAENKFVIHKFFRRILDSSR